MFKLMQDSYFIERIDDQAVIPADPGNRDYVAYLNWVAAGNAPEPAAILDLAVPDFVSRYQARAALLNAGLLEQVEAHFATLPDSSLDRLAWQEAPTVQRHSAALLSAANALGLTSEQVDNFFIQAKRFV